MLLLTRDHLIAIRDTFGFRPLCLGKLGTSHVVSSETCAFDLTRAEYVREVEAGGDPLYQQGRLDSVKPFPPTRHAHCIFEFIYFARPDSNIFTKKRLPGAESARPAACARMARRSRYGFAGA